MEIKKEKILEVKNLTVKYGLNQQPIIQNFSLEINRGDHLAIIGPSGCCLLYTSPSPRDRTRSRMPSSA